MSRSANFYSSALSGRRKSFNSREGQCLQEKMGSSKTGARAGGWCSVCKQPRASGSAGSHRGGRRSPAPLSGAVCRAGATDRGASSGAARGRRSIRTGLDLRPAPAGRGPEAVLTHLLGDQRFELPVKPRSTSPCSTGCLIRARTGQRSAGGRTCGCRRRSRSSSTPSTVPCAGWGRPGRP